MIKSEKGFTMVELLVSMAIMGLLVIMAFPTIRAIQTNNKNKKFEEYGKSVVSAAKLYVDSYGEDIFDPTKSSQRYQLNFDDLVKKDLIKDINMSDTTCITGKSNVWVVKYNDDYSYCLHLSCRLKNSDDSIEPVYESKDVTGSCKDIADKIQLVKYIYNDGTRDNEYHDEVIDGDDNYRLVASTRTGFKFDENHDVFLKWVNDGVEYDQSSIYDKIAHGGLEFVAKTRKWQYFLHFGKNTDGDYDGPTDLEAQMCSYGSSCELRPNPFSRVGYTFKHWKTPSATYADKEDVMERIGNNIPKDGYHLNLTAIFRKNICSVKYNANGGALQSDHSSAITLDGNKVLVNGNEVHHKVEYGDKLGTDGLLNYNNSSYLNIAKHGYEIVSGYEWNTESDGSGTTFNQTSRYEGTTLCPELGSGDKEVTMHAKWKIRSITCQAGKYLASNAVSCTTCTAGSYCPGGTYTFNPNSDQGINPCPTGYGHSAAGVATAGSCYMSVAANYYVASAHASSATGCAVGYEKAAHNVYYGNTSSCTKKSFTITYVAKNHDCNVSGSTASNTCKYGEACTLTANGFTASGRKSGHSNACTFAGWYDSSGNIYANGGTITIYNDVTLYGFWDDFKLDINVFVTTKKGGHIVLEANIPVKFDLWANGYLVGNFSGDYNKPFFRYGDIYGISNVSFTNNDISYANKIVHYYKNPPSFPAGSNATYVNTNGNQSVLICATSSLTKKELTTLVGENNVHDPIDGSVCG